MICVPSSVHIILCYLPTGTPHAPIGFKEVFNISTPEKSVHIFQWPTCPIGSKDILQTESGHEEDVTPDITTYFFEKSVQKDAFVSIVRENQCGLRSNMSNSIYIQAENCKCMHILLR